MRAVDLVASLPGVDMSRGVAAIGHSLGGHNAIFTAVFDPRISIVVTSCGFDSFLNYYEGAERNWYFGQGWCQIYELLGGSDRLAVQHPDCDHDFPDAQRQEAYRLIDSVLRVR